MALIDNAVKTSRLLDALKDAVPFKVELVPSLVSYLSNATHCYCRFERNTLLLQIRPSIPSPTYRMRAMKAASCAISFPRKDEKHS